LGWLIRGLTSLVPTLRSGGSLGDKFPGVTDPNSYLWHIPRGTFLSKSGKWGLGLGAKRQPRALLVYLRPRQVWDHQSSNLDVQNLGTAEESCGRIMQHDIVGAFDSSNSAKEMDNR
jgi:hypothetical protein